MPSDSPRPGPWLAAACVLGAAARLPGFLAGRSLWYDEAALAVNVLGRSYADLLSPPLDFLATAPVPFLLAARLLTRLLGSSEAVLRAPSLAAGLALPLAVWALGRRLVGPRAALLAAAGAALSPLLIAYSGEFKPYGAEALLSVLAAFLAVDWAERPGDRGSLARLAGGGVVLLALSSTAPLVLAPLAAAAACSPKASSPRARRALAGILAAWAAAGALLDLPAYLRSASEPFGRDFFGPRFLAPGAPALAERAALAARDVAAAVFLRRALPIGGGPWEAWLLAPLLAAGAVSLRRRRGAWAAALAAGPVAAALGASILGRLPFLPRYLVFAAPFLLLLAAAGLEAAAGLAPRGKRGAALLLLGALALSPAAVDALAAVREAASGGSPGDGVGEGRRSIVLDRAPRPLIRDLEDRVGPGEPVYVYHNDIPVWLYYTTDWRAHDPVRLTRVLAASGRPSAPSFPNALPRGRTVRGEGDELAYDYRGRRELLGLSDGHHWTADSSVPGPDPGWAENEARRLREAARPDAWLFRSMCRPSTARLLREAIERAGGVRVELREERGAALERYRFRAAASGRATSKGPR